MSREPILWALANGDLAALIHLRANTAPALELKIDPERRNVARSSVPLECVGVTTGIYVRAELAGEYGSHDIADLTRESLVDWLRSRPGWAEKVLLMLLGHAAAD
jgi:hypothetical protein